MYLPIFYLVVFLGLYIKGNHYINDHFCLCFYICIYQYILFSFNNVDNLHMYYKYILKIGLFLDLGFFFFFHLVQEI